MRELKTYNCVTSLARMYTTKHVKFKYILPSIYERFYPKSFWNSAVQETKATCDRCIQAPHKYDKDLKCCTFWPFIPNYIVGEILLSTEQKYKSVQELIRSHVKSHQWNLPMGLVAPSRYQFEFKEKKSKIFGQESKFLCPYYSKVNNNCSLWLYRGSVCTSFFCESSFGQSGHEFWQRFENYYSYLEMGISQEVLVYKDFSPRDVNEQLEYLMMEKKINFTKHRYEKIWKHFLGREIDFYIQAAEFARQMPKSQIQEIIGETGKEIQMQLMDSYKKRELVPR
ncbi:MAG: hypothetical protein JNL11_18980 [Bdellovibrionaceae bacterium]|nr:hypothetical protein [Pseudobdellovibrionaceae bacterium]